MRPYTREEVEEIMLEEPCEACLEWGWHWISFSGDLHYARGSCLTPNDVPTAVYD